MSLINEALKKAQRSRSAEAGDATPTVSGASARITRRRQPLPAQTLILMAGGAFALFVLAVVATVYVINRPSTPPPAVAKAPPPPAPAPAGEAPVIVAPVIAPVVATEPAPASPPPTSAAPVPDPAPAPVPEPVASTPSDPTPTPEPTPAAETPPTVPAAAPEPAAPTPDERVYAYIDALRVTAVRLQGNDSRVMMNERVYRLNDVVDRSLNIRLSRVEDNRLVFTDANGVEYVKYF